MEYLAYGVALECELELPHLLPATGQEPKVVIRICRVERVTESPGALLSTYGIQHRVVRLLMHDSYLALSVSDLFCFELWLSTGLIICRAKSTTTDDQIRYWLLQQIVPVFLMMNGTLDFLHGTSASVEPREDSTQPFSDCIAFLGPSYAGKSTLLAHFLSQGHALVTDDHVAFPTDSFTSVVPTIPFFRPYRAGEDLGVVAQNYSPAVRQLKRIYLLAPVKAGDEIRADKMEGMGVISSLMKDTQYSMYDLRAPSFLPLVEKRFRGLAHLSRNVSVVRLQVPRSLERLPEVYDFIQKNLAS
jgi:hypothetical protein